MLYRITKRANPLNRSEEKFYAEPTWSGELNLKGLCEVISNSSSVNRSDVRAVIETLIFQLPRELMNGMKVRLDDFGIFKLSFRSEGQETEDKVDASKINSIHLLFTPSTELKGTLKNTTFTKR